jgi:hypothetical protein
MPMIEEKRGWRMCSIHRRRTKQTHCYWCLKAEVYESRKMIAVHVCDCKSGICGRLPSVSFAIPDQVGATDYAAARAANENGG